jgi:ferredoxin
MAGEFDDQLTRLWEEEGLFSRDVAGQLIRLERATQDDYDLDVTLTIDGHELTVKKAIPTMDSQGNIVNDQDGRTVPRDTSVYDAAQQLYAKALGDVNPIPTLCYREHMRPVGVCRVCCVEVYAERDGKLVPGGRLIPACHHPVQPGMIVHTINSPEEDKSRRLRSAVKVLTELLAADHLRDASGNGGANVAGTNELAKLTTQMGCQPERFASRQPVDRGHDDSSTLIAVDHNACILCERCIRGCNEVKQNNVMGRTGKGYTTRIGFDLDLPMEASSCVSCGECMVSCPTGALTFRRPIESQWHSDLVAAPGYHAVTAEELHQHPLFQAVPFKWLQWNAASLVRRVVKKGDVLCWLGDYGATAFLLNRGEFGLWFREPAPQHGARARETWLGRLLRSIRGRARQRPRKQSRTAPAGEPDAVVTPEDVILGEMTCLSSYPRTATVVAWSDGEIFEMRRNVVYMLQRNATARKRLDQVYRERALRRHMASVPLFKPLTADQRQECVEFLRDKIDLIRVDPGQTIFRQGERADALYIVRVGFVKVSQVYKGQERVLRYLGPDHHFGEIGLLTDEEVSGRLDVPVGFSGRRTATCRALDDVEVVRIRADVYRELLVRFDALRERFQARSAPQEEQQSRRLAGGPLDAFLDQGLFNAQRLLVLDLESCTRCDECVRACADTHDGVTRLVREGLRFDKYLVASACRSCLDPYCMVGCPVDSIHRESSLEIVIEDHCIGCGLCARNCPYGNINMVGFDEQREDPQQQGRMMAVVQQKATTCDLCKSVGVDAQHPLDEVSCVYACPHNAAFRMSGADLYSRITRDWPE